MPQKTPEMLVTTISSQILALEDALAGGNGRAISAAFATVARSCGLAVMAARAGIPVSAVHSALAQPDKPDTDLLLRLLEALSSDLDTSRERLAHQK